MQTISNSNQNHASTQQGLMPRAQRLLRLKIWKLENGLTWVAMGKHMTGLKGEAVTGNAVQKALEGERMPVENHQALTTAYPHLPVELLPRPENTNKTHNPKIKPL